VFSRHSVAALHRPPSRGLVSINSARAQFRYCDTDERAARDGLQPAGFYLEILVTSHARRADYLSGIDALPREVFSYRRDTLRRQ
jgi:hypothetical protein